MTNHAAAVEAVRARHVWAERIPKEKWTEQLMQDQLEAAHLDRATLLRAYEALMEDHRVACGFVHQLQAAYEPLKAQHDTLRAQHAALVDAVKQIVDDHADVMADLEGSDHDCTTSHLATCSIILKLLATLGGAEGER